MYLFEVMNKTLKKASCSLGVLNYYGKYCELY